VVQKWKITRVMLFLMPISNNVLHIITNGILFCDNKRESIEKGYEKNREMLKKCPNPNVKKMVLIIQ
jgi:hypothetical protein